MLVLSRHRDESIVINGDIVITIVDIRGDKVRVGITAPKEITVHRQEVQDAITREENRYERFKPSPDSPRGGQPSRNGLDSRLVHRRPGDQPQRNA